jgi:hypothetical protein
MGLDFTGLITPTGVPFYGIVPGKAAMPLEQITLPVTFGTPTNYRTEFIRLKLQTLRHHIMPSLEDQHSPSFPPWTAVTGPPSTVGHRECAIEFARSRWSAGDLGLAGGLTAGELWPPTSLSLSL